MGCSASSSAKDVEVRAKAIAEVSAQYEATLAERDAKLAERDAKVTALEAENEQYKAKVTTLEAENAQSKAALEAEKAQSKGWLDSLTAENERLKAGPEWEQVEALKAQVASLTAETQRLKLKAQPSASGGLVADAPPVPEALRPLHERAEAALRPVRERAEAAKQEAHGAHAKAALPEALRTFTPLAQEPEVKEAATALAPCEQALVLALRNGSADAEKTEVRAKVAALARTLADKIAEKTGRADLAPLVKECEAAISAGNVDFQRVYDGVFRVIQSAEAEHLEKYNATVAALRKLLTGEAKQRDEAADPVTLLVDAAQAKPAFDAVVRCLEGATGARLELQTLGPSTTGLKKLSRILEKAQLRPGERRGKTERVCDVVRAMFVCNAMATVALIGEALAALHKAGVIVVSRAARAQRAALGHAPPVLAGGAAQGPLRRRAVGRRMARPHG